jgi:hypothetical protein
MSRINPYFELEGNRYEIKRTRWLINEYKKLGEEMPLSAEDKANAITANNLVADAKKFADKANEMWDKLCENPTPENKATYFMFKEMSDEAIAKYNDFIAKNDAVNTSFKHTIDILEKTIIKGLAEQYFGFNENLAKQTWEKFVDTKDSHDDIAEWLMAAADSLFGEEDNEENNDDFLSMKRKADMERENNRKNALRKRR